MLKWLGKLVFLQFLAQQNYGGFTSGSLKPRIESFCYYDERQMSCYSNYNFKISIEVLTK